MSLAVTFWSQPQVVTDSWVELASTITLIAFVVGMYKHFECHRSGCHRPGRFVHGHYKLCHLHHPLVPDDGKITQAQIDAIEPQSTAAAARPRPSAGEPAADAHPAPVGHRGAGAHEGPGADSALTERERAR